MNEEEIGRLVITMLGDVEPYLRALRQADQETRQTTSHLRDAGRDVEGFGTVIDNLGRTIGTVLGIMGAGLGLWTSFHAFSEQQEAEVKLTAAIQARGGAITESLDAYKKFASEMQEQSVLADEVVLGLVRQAEMYELSGEKAEGATRKAMELAAAVDGTVKSAASYVRIAAALEKGDTQRAMLMARYVPQLRGVKTETEFLEKAFRLLAAGEAQMAGEAGTAHGRLEQLKNSFNDFQENVGGVVAEGLVPLVALLKGVTIELQQVSPETLRTIVGIVALVAALKTIMFVGGSLIGVLKNVFLGLEALSTALAMSPTGWIAVATLAVAMAAVAYSFKDLGPKAREFADQMERAARSANYVAKSIEGVADEALMKNRQRPQAQQEAFLKNNIKLLEDQIKSSREALKDREERSGGIGKWVSRFLAPDAVKSQEESFKAAQKQIDELSKAVMRYKAELSSLTDSGVSPELAKMLEDVTQKMFLQYKGIGLTADELERYKLVLTGVPEGKLKEFDLLSKLTEGAKVTEQYQTKQEKLAKELARVQDLFLAGAISAQTYDRAMEQLINTTNDLGSAQAHLVGGASGIEMQQKYDQMLANMTRPTPEANRPPLLQLEETNKFLNKIEKNTADALKKKARELSPVGAEELP